MHHQKQKNVANAPRTIRDKKVANASPPMNTSIASKSNTHSSNVNGQGTFFRTIRGSIQNHQPIEPSGTIRGSVQNHQPEAPQVHNKDELFTPQWCGHCRTFAPSQGRHRSATNFQKQQPISQKTAPPRRLNIGKSYYRPTSLLTHNASLFSTGC